MICSKTDHENNHRAILVFKDWFDSDCRQTRWLYKRKKNRYKHTKSNQDLIEMRRANIIYKNQLKRSRNKAKKSKIKEIRNLKSTDPKEYWKLINAKNTKKSKCAASLDALFKHFKDINNIVNDDDVDNNGELNQTESEIDTFLNSRITEEEISHVIKGLNSNKACGIDMILNEYLKNTLNIMLSKYVVLFNEVLTSGHVPDSWAIGKIVPIFKNKGDNTDPSEYRGITLLSCLGKAFTTIVNNRLTSVVDIHYNQAGFRKDHSVIGHIFLLKNLTDLYINNKKNCIVLSLTILKPLILYGAKDCGTTY